MNSNKQKKKKLKARKKQRIENCLKKSLNNLGYGRIKANHEKLTHTRTCRLLPNSYKNQYFKCRDCVVDEVWTAKQQKFYYEECKGQIDSVAVRCKDCRNIIKQVKKKQLKHMQELENTEPHPNELFFKDLERFKVK